MTKDDLKKENRRNSLFWSKVNIPEFGLGYVVGYYHGFYAVDFDDFVKDGNTCSGLCRKWHGKWIHEDEVEFGIAIRFVKN